MNAAQEKTHISFTEITTYLACRRKWGYSYYHRIRPTVPNKHMMLGSAIHKALGVYYSGEKRDIERQALALDVYQDAMSREIARSETISRTPSGEDLLAYFTLGSDMLVQYFSWAQTHDHFTPKGTEVRLVVPIGNSGLSFVGYVDMFAEEPDGAAWIYDHKTYTNMPSERRFVFDMQGTAYAWACRQDTILREKGIRGIVYNVLLKRVPKQPQVLKNGSLSKDKHQSTTPKMYRLAIKERNLDEADYTDILAVLDPDRFNGRIPIPITPQRIAAFESQLITLAGMIQNAYEAGPVSHVACASGACEYCEFYALCKLSFEGYDWRSAQGEFYSLNDATDSEEVADAEDNS